MEEKTTPGWLLGTKLRVDLQAWKRLLQLPQEELDHSRQRDRLSEKCLLRETWVLSEFTASCPHVSESFVCQQME